MPKVFTSKTQKIGEIGEYIAVRYLEGKGYKIVERNYTKKWGEIDIVCKKQGRIHFVEVKSKTAQNLIEMEYGDYRPEDNMHPWKIRRLSNTIQTYLMEKSINENWQVDLAVVYILKDMKTAKVEVIENII